MPTVETKLNASGNRKSIRDHVINTFMLEDAGLGKGENCSRYLYIVEVIPEGNIVIKRPANLNKGMDFTVHVDGIKFKQKGAFKDMPKHDDIAADLGAKLAKDPQTYGRLRLQLLNIYNCSETDVQSFKEIGIEAGLLTTEQVLLTAKWLFIEQDVTYWNWSGRAMLFEKLSTSGLV